MPRPVSHLIRPMQSSQDHQRPSLLGEGGQVWDLTKSDHNVASADVRIRLEYKFVVPRGTKEVHVKTIIMNQEQPFQRRQVEHEIDRFMRAENFGKVILQRIN